MLMVGRQSFSAQKARAIVNAFQSDYRNLFDQGWSAKDTYNHMLNVIPL